jgi:hypothetical protein
MKSLPTLLLLLVGLCVVTLTTKAFQRSPSSSVPEGGVESIYIARSLRESRGTPTQFCAQGRIGFGSATSEDQYTFRSTETRASDGLMVNTNVNTIGRLHACFGSTPDAAISNFYAEGVLGGVPFTGRGECRRAKQNYPESGINVSRCFLELRDLPKGICRGATDHEHRDFT